MSARRRCTRATSSEVSISGVSGVNGTDFFSGVVGFGFPHHIGRRRGEHRRLEDPLRKVEVIRGVSLNFKENPAHQELDPHQRRIGVLAQDVQKVLPEAVTAGPDGFSRWTTTR